MAEQFADLGLKEECSFFIQECIEDDNVLELLNIADLHSAPHLRGICLYYFISNYERLCPLYGLGIETERREDSLGPVPSRVAEDIERLRVKWGFLSKEEREAEAEEERQKQLAARWTCDNCAHLNNGMRNLTVDSPTHCLSCS